MAKYTTVEQAYRHGRSHPHGRNTDDGAHHRVHHSPDLEAARTAPEEKGALGEPVFNSNEVQGAEGRHDEPRYSNDTPDDWRRGAGPDGATGKPNFDHSPPRSKMRR